jgi:site-specific recombinase XerD
MNPSSTWSGFVSCMAPQIGDFLKHHRALGKSFTNEEHALRLFDRYLVEQKVSSIEQISSSVLDSFLRSRPRTTARSHNHLLNVLGRLFRWLVRQQRLLHSPLDARPHRCPQPQSPFLFEACQVDRLLALAARLPDEPHSHHRGSTYRMIFGLMYALGLRVGEAARLCRKDVDLDQRCLLIRQTKFSKTRIVPFGPRLAAALEAYLQEREQRHGLLLPDDPAFSVDRSGRQPLRSHSISRTFHHLVAQLNLTITAGVAQPRLHCLRHSFAVSTLLRWYRAGIEPSARLLYLSTFLGHVSPTSTAVYLTITAELLEHASERFHRYSAPILQEKQQ